jgi:hypothetical protein
MFWVTNAERFPLVSRRQRWYSERSAQCHCVSHSPVLPLTFRKKNFTNILKVTATLKIRFGVCCMPIAEECNLWSVSHKQALDATTRPFRSPTFPHHPQINPIKNIDCCYKLCSVAYLQHTVRCANLVRQVLCCYTVGRLHDVALLNRLKANIWKGSWNRQMWRC